MTTDPATIWGDLPSWLSAIGTIGTLTAGLALIRKQGNALDLQSQALRLEIDHLRETIEERNAEQAGKVRIFRPKRGQWPNRENASMLEVVLRDTGIQAPPLRLEVENGSDAAISNVVMRIPGHPWKHALRSDERGHAYGRDFNALPAGEAANFVWLDDAAAWALDHAYLRFTDVGGRRWQRMYSGALTSVHEDTEAPGE